MYAYEPVYEGLDRKLYEKSRHTNVTPVRPYPCHLHRTVGDGVVKDIERLFAKNLQFDGHK
jgi:hypothetical protein